MPLLNYTTTIKAEKTVSEIQALLAEAGAEAVMSEYEDSVLSSISFRMTMNGQQYGFQLPARIDKVWAILQNDSRVARKLKTREQAARVTWRIVKAWIEAQLALIEAEQAELPEVFLPYMQSPTGETLYQAIEQRGLGNLLGHNQT